MGRRSGVIRTTEAEDRPRAEAQQQAAATQAFDLGQLSAIVDAVADGITVQDTDGRVIFANAQAARASGFDTPADMLAAGNAQILSRFELLDEHREALPAPDLPGAVVLRAGGTSRRIVGFRDRKSGDVGWADVTATAVRGPDGQVRYAVNAFRDVSLQILMEEVLQARSHEGLAGQIRLADLARVEHARAAELRAILGAIGDPIIVVASNLEITLANPAAEVLLLESLAERTLPMLLERFRNPPPADVQQLIARSPLVLAVRTTQSAERWFELAAYPVGATPQSDYDGETIFILHDVTEVRQREAIRDSFVGVLSHELRTPVTTIYAGSKVLVRPGSHLDEHDRTEILDDIHSEAERLHRLVEDVVALTRYGEGALEIGTDPVLLQRVIPSVIRSEEGRWPSGRFEADLPPDLPPVAGDITYVEQVLRNLLANAMKYGGPAPVAQVTVEVEGPEVVVRVRDSGPGFPQAEAARLFELYYRSPAVSRVMAGSGIGLFVCARLIEAMGGRIWAANRPEGGAEFGFTLRVLDGEDEPGAD
jgi:PAS domain S-box-containing protein